MKVLATMLFSAFIALNLVSCTLASKSTEIGQFKVPEGWSKSTVAAFKKLTAPEKDMHIYFYKEKVNKDLDFGKKSVALWKKIDPSFSYKELQTTTPPSKDWDRVSQIIYQVPAEKSKTVLTIMKIKDGVGYFNLLEGSSSTLNRRMAQMIQVFESWKPDSIKDEDYSKVSSKKFDNVEKEFEKFLVDSMSDLKIPGMTIGITQNGKVVYQKGFGKTSVKNGRPVNKDTLFMIGSTTKPLTTLLMSKLIYDGKLNWADPINKNLKGWRLKDPKTSKGFLMKHTACACTGMPRRDLDFIFEIDGISAEQRMNQMALMAPTTKPGETFQYSNYLVAAGGFSAARAYNKSLPLEKAYTKAMNELVFSPLGMNQTLVSNSSPYKANSAYPHSFDLDLQPRIISTKIEEFANSVAPAGSVWSNSTDMLKYLQFELNKGQNITSYIDEKNLLARRKKGIPITKDMSYGLGLMVLDYKGISVVEHGGNTMGFTSEMLFLPEKNIGITMLVNMGSANGFTRALRGKFFELMFGMDTKAAESLDFYKKERVKDVAKLKSLMKKKIKGAKALIGKYKSKELGRLSIFSKNSRLIADFGEFTSEIKEKSDPGKKRVFLLTSPPWGGSFSLIEDKNGFVIDAAQQKYSFKRL
ncbi:serine hydrolase [Bdellovibrionales bacterium]|nr:serine hydrolase [Bdellovibrionales bacterium]